MIWNNFSSLCNCVNHFGKITSIFSKDHNKIILTIRFTIKQKKLKKVWKLLHHMTSKSRKTYYCTNRLNTIHNFSYLQKLNLKILDCCEWNFRVSMQELTMGKIMSFQTGGLLYRPLWIFNYDTLLTQFTLDLVSHIIN